MTFVRVVSSLSAPDYFLMRRVHRWMPPRWVRWWMLAATRAGDGWLWAACGVLLLVSGDDRRYAALAAAALAVVSGILIFRYMKKAVRRTRPCDIEVHCWISALPPDRFSFPSGHSITAFAVAVPLGLFYPSVRTPLLFCASSVAISRIVLGMHFLSDVIAGSLIGAGLGFAGFLLIS